MDAKNVDSTSLDDEAKRLSKRYDVALETRKFEIELFWKRSFFFWGFIAAAFVAFNSDRVHNLHLKLLIALFGLVCSFCWTLANRGSKYWQENWEYYVDQLEDEITGPLFKIHAPVRAHKFWWLRARKFSVSKLAIALSDYITVIWFGISGYCISQLPFLKSVCSGAIDIDKDLLILHFSVFTIAWMVFTYKYAKTTETPVKQI